MKNIVTILTAAVLGIGLTGQVGAQVIDPALAEARARVACGSGTLISSQYLGGGRIQVTCSQNVPSQSLPETLSGTSLTTVPVVTVVAVVGLVALLSGNGDKGTTTTTSTTESPSETFGGL